MYDIHVKTANFPAQNDMPIRRITIGDLIREAAAECGDSEALIEITLDGDIGRCWTFNQLLQDAERLALALSTRFSPSEKVVIWSPNHPEWILFELASALAGLVTVTANPALQEKELEYVLTQSDSVGLFLVDDFRGNPMAKIGNAVAANLPAIREVTSLLSEELYAQGENPASLPMVSSESAAMIQYTSGTTGFPKGAVLSHTGLVNNAYFYTRRCGASADSTWMNVMPMFHTAGCSMAVLGCLQARCRLVLVGVFEPDVVLDQIVENRVSNLMGVPTMILALLEAQESNPRDLSSLNLISCGGSMVAPELVKRVGFTFQSDFSTVYGQTEYSPVVTQHHIEDSLDDICNFTGQPVPQTDVSIRAIDSNKVCAVGEVGEICARGPCVMLEYYANPDATRDAIDADGWLHTGDLGKMDQRGYVAVTGRVKEMIIRGGENFFPAEIENCLLEHPAIADAAVVGIPDPKWGEVIAAFIRSNQGPLTRSELHAHCREHMSPQKTPTVWCQVEEFPLTGSGKVQKFNLRDGFIDGLYSEIPLRELTE